MSEENANINLLYKKDYFGFVYLWYDKKKDKLCIGSHFGNLNDGYTTSTGHCKFAIKKRPKDFERIILYIHTINDRKLLLEKEQLFLNCIDIDLLGNYFYNRKKFASGGSIIGSKRSEKTKLAISLSQKGKKRNQKFNISGLLKTKEKKECLFCYKIIDVGNYSKYHGKNCKLNPNIDIKILEKRTMLAKKAASFKIKKSIKNV